MKIGFALAIKMNRRRWVGIFITCRAHGVCLGWPWLALAGPFLSLLTQTGVETATVSAVPEMEPLWLHFWQKS